MAHTMGRLGAGAALLGGTAWFAKGAWVLLTLDQPPVLYELGPPLFLVAAAGLWTRLPETRARNASGKALALAAGLFAVAAVLAVLEHLQGEAWEVGSNTASLVAMLAFLVALAWVGHLLRRAKALRPVHALPFFMAVAFLPLLVGLGILGLLMGGHWEERLIEVPIVLWGVGWIVLGLVLLRP